MMPVKCFLSATTQRQGAPTVLNIWTFDIVSSFDIRISDLSSARKNTNNRTKELIFNLQQTPCEWLSVLFLKDARMVTKGQ